MLPVRLKSSGGIPITSSNVDGEEMLNVVAHTKHTTHFYQQFLRRSTGSIEAAIDASSAGGATLDIWNGTGSLDTGGDWTVTGPGSESSTAAHSGTNGYDTGVLADKDIVEWDNGSSLSLSSYDTLSFWLQIKNSPGTSRIEVEWRENGNKIGDKVVVHDYISVVLDTWILVSIPLSDFFLTGSVDTLRFKFAKGANQHHWIDDIQLLKSGGLTLGPQRFWVEGFFDCTETRVEVSTLSLLISGTSAGWAIGDFATHDGGLSNGVIIRYWDFHTGEVEWSFNLVDNKDLFSRFLLSTSVSFLDTNRVLRLDLDLSSAPPRIRGTKTLEMLVRDDLSDLTSFRALITGSTVR